MYVVTEDVEKGSIFFRDVLKLLPSWPLDNYKSKNIGFLTSGFWSGNFNIEVLGTLIPGSDACAFGFDAVGDHNEALEKLDKLGFNKQKFPRDDFIFSEVNETCQSEFWKRTREFYKDGPKPVWTMKGLIDLGKVEEGEIIPKHAPYCVTIRYHVD